MRQDQVALAFAAAWLLELESHRALRIGLRRTHGMNVRHVIRNQVSEMRDKLQYIPLRYDAGETLKMGLQAHHVGAACA